MLTDGSASREVGAPSPAPLTGRSSRGGRCAAKDGAAACPAPGAAGAPPPPRHSRSEGRKRAAPQPGGRTFLRGRFLSASFPCGAHVPGIHPCLAWKRLLEEVTAAPEKGSTPLTPSVASG
ncbi:hypothetical protein DV515_00018497, partial [Chloebia gouldiae]